MSTRSRISVAALSIAWLVAGSSGAAADGKKGGTEKGKVELESAGPLAVGPGGVLFVADPMAARVVAIVTADKPASTDRGQRVEGIDRKVAAVLGTKSPDIRIVDMVVHPASGAAYLSVARGRAPDSPGVLVRVDRAGKIEAVDLGSVEHSSATLENVPGKGEFSGRGRRQYRSRTQSITDIAYVDGRVLVAGMSTEEFASTLRSVPYPFGKSGRPTSIEIYHGAHGRFETRSPVRTFVSLDVGGTPHILAAYQCTPLVSIPLSDLQPGARVKGTTVAELGNRNRPLDMIVYRKGGEEYMLIANNSRGIMKIRTVELGKDHNVTSKVSSGKSEGVPYETIKEWTGVHQLDRADSKNALVVRATDEGTFNLETLPLP